MIRTANDSTDCLCVLGMHRSGTSCLTGIIQRMGVELGEVHERNPFNARGNREHPRIMAFNEGLLESNGGNWHSPVLVTQWSAEQAAERDAIIRSLRQSHEFWGFKDPRSLFTLPCWLAAISPKFIATFRHPLKVAASLGHRDRFPLQRSLEIWECYNRRLLELLEADPSIPLVNFDLPSDDYLDDVLTKLVQLGLDASQATHARAFYAESLKRQDEIDLSRPLPNSTAQLYQRLLDYFARQASEPG